MANINFATLTIPTPEPYTKSESTRNVENVCYVLLQMFIQGKANGVVLNDQRLIDIKTAIQGISLSVGAADLTTINAELTAIAEALG
jgi:hypothetical protein